MVLSGDDGGRDWGPGRLQVEDTFQALLRLLALLAGHLTEYPNASLQCLASLLRVQRRGSDSDSESTRSLLCCFL